LAVQVSGEGETQHVTLRAGIVCTPGRDLRTGRERENTDNYLLGENGRVAWRQKDAEGHATSRGTGVLLALADGDDSGGDGEVAARSAVRVLGKLYSAFPPPREPLLAMMRFVADAHTRMYWKARAERTPELGASLGVVWLAAGRLVWAEVGTVRVFLYRDGKLRRLGRPWPLGEHQRFIRGSKGLGDDTSLHVFSGRNAGQLDLQVGDRIVVASDGMWRWTKEVSAAQILRQVAEPQAAAVALRDHAVAAGGVDDVSVAVLDGVLPAAPAVEEEPLELDAPPPLFHSAKPSYVVDDAPVTFEMSAPLPEVAPSVAPAPLTPMGSPAPVSQAGKCTAPTLAPEEDPGPDNRPPVHEDPSASAPPVPAVDEPAGGASTAPVVSSEPASAPSVPRPDPSAPSMPQAPLSEWPLDEVDFKPVAEAGKPKSVVPRDAPAKPSSLRFDAPPPRRRRRGPHSKGD